nr:MAG TPA_asm: hypothetical protein [Caudoviricetes sp.]
MGAFFIPKITFCGHQQNVQFVKMGVFYELQNYLPF